MPSEKNPPQDEDPLTRAGTLRCPNCKSTRLTETPDNGSEIPWFKCEDCKHATANPHRE